MQFAFGKKFYTIPVITRSLQLLRHNLIRVHDLFVLIRRYETTLIIQSVEIRILVCTYVIREAIPPEAHLSLLNIHRRPACRAYYDAAAALVITNVTNVIIIVTTIRAGPSIAATSRPTRFGSVYRYPQPDAARFDRDWTVCLSHHHVPASVRESLTSQHRHVATFAARNAN